MVERISDRIIERAVELWCRTLRTPKFDNGDVSPNGLFGTALASKLIEIGKESMTDAEQQIEVFRNALTERLKKDRDADEYFSAWLDTDYQPCTILMDAAVIAGIPESQFSCKSSVCMSQGYVTSSFGYNAPRIYDYPLKNTMWLRTDLSGSIDLKKIIYHVEENGNEMGFDVDPTDRQIVG